MADADIFDLRNVLADRSYPTEEVTVWFDTEGGAELDRLEKEIANEQDEKKLEILVNEYAKKLEEFKNRRYVFTLQAISRRKKQDIQSKALHLIPYKRDALGRDDIEQEYQRGLKLKDLVYEAYIVKIVNPEGKVQEGEKLDLSVIEIITGYAPDSVINRIDAGIEKLDTEADIQRYGHLDPDFLSKP